MWQKEAVCPVPALDHCNHFRAVLRSFFQLQVIPDASLQPLENEALLQLQTTEAHNKAFEMQVQKNFWRQSSIVKTSPWTSAQ